MQFIKHYFKTRALRQISQWLVIAAVSILSLSFFAIADAYAATTCNGADIDGITTHASLPNTNALDFTDPPNAAYRAEVCPYISPNNFLELKGWVWNSNLGWISLYCNNKLNAGLACGDYNYGVKINKADGKMYGWAWSDNIGWISFGCPGGAGATNDGAACGIQQYSGTTQLTVEPGLGAMTGYAWADTVGWFSLTGASARLLPVVVPVSTTESNIGIWTKVENDNEDIPMFRNAKPIKAGRFGGVAPLANGVQAYDIFVNLADFNGNPVDVGDPAITAAIETSWEDSVQFDQTLSATDREYIDPQKLALVNIGPVSKAGKGTNLFAAGKNPTGGSPNTLHAAVTSTAPTEFNCYVPPKMSACEFWYRHFGDGIPPQTLKYLGASITVTLDHGGGDVESVTRLVSPLRFDVLEYRPPVEVTVFDYLPDPDVPASAVNYIESYRNKADYFNISRPPSSIPNPNTTLYLKTDSPDVEYGWIENLEEEIPEGGAPDSKEYSAGTHIAMPYAPDEQLASMIEGAKAYSIVDYVLGGKTIKYYSNGVPRTLDSAIINQSAEFLSGPVYSPGAIRVREGDVVVSIGDLDTNNLRTSLLRNISGMIAGIPSPDLRGDDFDFFLNEGYTELAQGYAYYYKNADVRISDLSWLAGVDHPVTLIVEGDVYVDTNINSPAVSGTAPGVPFGLIVLEKDRHSDEGDRGGRVYVHADVTDLVNVNIWADHAMFRYTDGICYFIEDYGPALRQIQGQREPNFARADRCSASEGAGAFKEPVTNLVNQFYLKGTVASENCIGCSTLSNLYRGDGKLIGPPTPEHFAIARLYDFNFFSYFRQRPDSSLSGNRSESIKIIEIARSLGADSMLGPVYFDYAAPPADMAGFAR